MRPRFSAPDRCDCDLSRPPAPALGRDRPGVVDNPSFTTSGTPVISGTANDYSAVNQGQLKNIAVTAVNELNTDLAQFGGAGATLNQLAITLTATSAQTNDYAALNLGQLKAVAQPFYDRLISLSCTIPPIISGTYPWAVTGKTPNDYGIANIGEVKQLFSFDVTYSSAGTGIPDWWVNEYFPGSTFDGQPGIDPNSLVAWSGSQVTMLTAYQNGWNPIDFYNGQTPNLTIISGTGQTGSPGAFVSGPLVVSITDTNGNPLPDAPVTFAAAPGGGFLQGSSTSGSSTSLTVLADGNGQAQAFFQLPNIPSSTNTVTVAAGTGSPAATGTFSEFADDGTGNYPSPFAPSNIIGTMNSDGSETITWQNNDNESPIYIYEQSGGSWVVTGTLPAGTTSCTISSTAVGLTQIGNCYADSGPGGGAPGPDGGNGGHRPPFVPFPTQSYAAIDISNPVTTADVKHLALDDGNNAAFDIVPPGSGPVTTGTWREGKSNIAQTYSIPDDGIIQEGDIEYSYISPPDCVTVKGDSCSAGNVIWDWSNFMLTWLKFSSGEPSAVAPPLTYESGPGGGEPSDMFADAHDYGWCGWAGGFLNGSGTTIYGGVIVPNSGQTTIFDHLLATQGSTATDCNVVDAFFPASTNECRRLGSGLRKNHWLERFAQ